MAVRHAGHTWPRRIALLEVIARGLQRRPGRTCGVAPDGLGTAAAKVVCMTVLEPADRADVVLSATVSRERPTVVLTGALERAPRSIAPS